MLNDKMVKLTFSNKASIRMKSDFIGYKKKTNALLKECRQNSKAEMCYFCNKKCSSFCNSHSIPQFVLRNIANKGLIATPNSIIGIELLDSCKGINDIGTFRLICNECDSKIFSEYECPENYDMIPTQKMMAQISLKNCMLYISKRRVENAIYEKMLANKNFSGIAQTHLSANELDIRDFEKCYKRAINSITKNDIGYYMCSYDELNYIAPIAFQGRISLVCDFDGNIVNDIYCFDKNYYTSDLNICIFPLKEKTVVFTFIDNGAKRYRNFYRKLNKMDKENRLAVIQYIMLLYSEDYYVNIDIANKMKKNKAVKRICQTTSNQMITIFDNPYANLLSTYDLNEYNSIPNYLLRDFCLK